MFIPGNRIWSLINDRTHVDQAHFYLWIWELTNHMDPSVTLHLNFDRLLNKQTLDLNLTLYLDHDWHFDLN